jgi:hypothetical protein
MLLSFSAREVSLNELETGTVVGPLQGRKKKPQGRMPI